MLICFYLGDQSDSTPFRLELLRAREWELEAGLNHLAIYSTTVKIPFFAQEIVQ